MSSPKCVLRYFLSIFLDKNNILSIVDLKKNFGKLEVLKGISFDVYEGDRVAIIGPSGSGKTTMLRCINGLEKAESGEIIIKDKKLNIAGKDIHKVREEVGFIFQRFNLFSHLTAMENLMLAQKIVKKRDKKEAEKISIDLLKKVGLESKVEDYPSQLSGGQQQRVAIARALAMDPSILLMDEVTSALDPELVNEVLEVINDLAESGMTMILVTHEMRFAKNVANKVMFIDGGYIVEEGTPDQIFNNPKKERTKIFLNSISKHN